MTSTVQILQPQDWGTLTDTRLDSLRLWQLMIGAGRLPQLAIRKDPVPAGVPFQTMLRDKGLQKGSMALALELPFDRMPACQDPGHPRVGKIVRRYLDELLAEAHLVGQLLQQNRTVTHLFWLGDPCRWLSRAELTEVMFRLGQFFHLRQGLCRCAAIEMEHWNTDAGLYALLCGLGFSHLLLETNRLDRGTLTPQLQQYWEQLHLTALSRDPSDPAFTRLRFGEQAPGNQTLETSSPEMMRGAPHELMLGLGLGAWSVLDHRLFHNTPQLDLYYRRLSENRLPSLEAGTWRHQN